MFQFEKQNKTDFVILNLADVQLCECHWDKEDENYQNFFAIADHTIRTLIDRVKPDLITMTGDLSGSEEPKAYPAIGRYLDSFGIPWCTVWGNRDQRGGIAFVYSVLEDYRANCKHFFHEDGDPSLGNGNYLITISQNGKPLHTLFMLDSHDGMHRMSENDPRKLPYIRMVDAQMAWYRQQAKILKEKGLRHSSLLMHMPIKAYQRAWEAAFDNSVDPKSVDPKQTYGAAFWKPGYEGSFGVCYEDVRTAPYEDTIFETVQQTGITQNIMVGHNHVNNFCIPYQGINLIFASHVGKGCYWDKRVNGGTVLTIDDTGAARVRHEYVDVTHLLQEYDV